MFWNGPPNTMDEIAFIKIVLVYSAMKSRANGPAAYSTLNPDTSSDSQSVRSKGLRFVSARVEISHIMAIGHAGKIGHVVSWVIIRLCRERDPLIKKVESRIMAIVTSYEMVCATARRALNREYFEFETQPHHRIE